MHNKCILQGSRISIKKIKQTTASIFMVENIFLSNQRARSKRKPSVSSTLKMAAVRAFEMLVKYYQTIWRPVREDGNL
jgi:hypothetical protein